MRFPGIGLAEAAPGDLERRTQRSESRLTGLLGRQAGAEAGLEGFHQMVFQFGGNLSGKAGQIGAERVGVHREAVWGSVGG